MQVDNNSSAMIDRVVSLLEAFVGHRTMTAAEIARRSQLPRSSAHRILQRLVKLGWVERHGFEYALGIRMFELGTQVPSQRSVRTALPVMTELNRQTGLTAYLSILVGSEVLHLERVGAWPDNHREASVGARQPAESAAAGHALLAAMDPQERPELAFASASTVYCVRTRLQLERKLQEVHDRGGIAVDDQGCTLGVTVIAAPIEFDPSRVALSLCGPSHLVNIEAIVKAVRRGAANILHASSGSRSGTTNRLHREDRVKS